MLVVELAGTIKVLPPPYTQPDPTPFLQLTNIGSAGVQQGIYDIALDPAFATNHFYYVFYTLGSPNRDRLSRFTANSSLTGTVAGSEKVLYQDPQDANAEHHGGAIMFGNDGKLYFTTGEHFDPPAAQSLTSPRGKIHRINPDGTVPTDNPFYDGNGPNVDSIWARGLRNPFRAYYDAPTGKLFIGDVGGNDYSTAKEEIDVGAAGANYAWPNCEGICGAPYTNPIYTYAPQRPRRRGRRRLRLPRQPVPELLPGQLLLRRLRAELDQAPDLRRERERQRRLQLRARRRLGRRSVRRHRLPDRRARTAPSTTSTSATRTSAARTASARSGASATSSRTRRRSRSPRRRPTSGPPPLDVNFSSAGSSDPEGQPLTYSGRSATARPRRPPTRPTPTPRPGGTRRG